MIKNLAAIIVVGFWVKSVDSNFVSLKEHILKIENEHKQKQEAYQSTCISFAVALRGAKGDTRDRTVQAMQQLGCNRQ
jgi:hypothetical protein